MNEKLIDNLIVNALLNIKTNLNINLKLVARFYGGTFDSTLPALRKCILLNRSRYSFLIYATGEIILGNFHFQCQKSILFSWIVSFLATIVNKKIASIRQASDESNSYETSMCISKTLNLGKIRVLFLLQNVAFSANFSKFFQRSIVFDDEKIKNIAEKIKQDIDTYNHVQYSPIFEKQTRFPANIVKCVFNRCNSNLYKFKSNASCRRQLACNQAKISKRKYRSGETLFNKQNCAFSVFSSGLVNTTGATVKQDVVNILKVLEIFNSFLET